MDMPPKRRPTRLPEYGYSQAGVYFLTVCAKDRENLLSRVCVGGGVLDAPHVELTECGEVIRHRLEEMDRIYGHMSLLKYVIMPNHIHILLRITDGPSGTPAPTRGRANEAVPAYISTLKRMTNQTCGRNIWQRGYHDHVVRNDGDFLRIWQYIDTNPAKWAEDRYYVP